MAELSIAQIQEIYGIKQAAACKWRRYLAERKISATQENLDSLRDHIAEHGSYKGFGQGGEIARVEKAAIVADEELEFLDQDGGVDPVMALVRAAQSRAAGEIMAERLLAAEFRANPDRLDSDLQERIREVEERTAPKSVDPMQYAQRLLQQRKSREEVA